MSWLPVPFWSPTCFLAKDEAFCSFSISCLTTYVSKPFHQEWLEPLEANRMIINNERCWWCSIPEWWANEPVYFSLQRAHFLLVLRAMKIGRWDDDKNDVYRRILDKNSLKMGHGTLAMAELPWWHIHVNSNHQISWYQQSTFCVFLWFKDCAFFATRLFFAEQCL